MTLQSLPRTPPHTSRAACTPAEWETRCDQAALYRLLDHYGMSDLANQVIGARIKDDPDHYLLHQYGLFYEEITASSLIKTDGEGRALDPAMPQPVDGAQNLAKWIFGTRPEVNFFIHGHCEDVMAVSATKKGLQAVSQAAVYLMHLVTYIDYEFFEDEEYGEKFKRTLGDKGIMITRNHGYYVLGRSAPEAFFRTYFLRQACSVQVKTLAMKDEPHIIDPQQVARMQDQMYESEHYNYDGTTEWAALLRKLDREQPDYKT
ncbi:MAG: class II aldolase/adducin family protein [Kiloniellales bacterium]|nr:class II aldolase/adducin family protein [Kiloniellales bacterium]